MNTCPCCAEVLLRHARHDGVYWFCTYCWQEMPDLVSEMENAHRCLVQPTELINLPVSSYTEFHLH